MVVKAVVSRFLGTGSVSQDIGRVMEQGMKSPAMERMWVHGGTALGQALLKVLTGPAMKSFIADAAKGLVQDQFGTTGGGKVLGSMAGNAASSLIQAGGTAASAAVGRASKEELKNRSADIEAEKRAQERAEKDEENRKRLERVVSAYRYSDPRLGDAREGQYQKGSRWRKTALKQAEEQLKGLGYDREEDRLGILGVEKGRFGGMKDKPIDMSEFTNMPSESSADRAKREMVHVTKTLVEGINETLTEYSKLDTTPVSSETKAIDKLAAQQRARGGITQGLIMGAAMKVADMAISGTTDAASAEIQNYTTSGMLSSSLRQSSMNSDQFYNLMKSPGRQFGYTNQQSLEASSAFAQTTNLSPDRLNANMNRIAGFSNAYGLDLPTQAAAMAQAGSLGFIGVPGQAGQSQFGGQGLMGYLASQYAGSSGLAKMDSFQTGLFDVSRIMQATTAAPANITGGGQFSVGNIYGTMNRSNNQALVGTQGGALLSQLSQGITQGAAQGGPVSMLWYNALSAQGGGALSPADLPFITEGGMSPTKLYGHTYDPVQALYQLETKGVLSQMSPANRNQILSKMTGGNLDIRQVGALFGGIDPLTGTYKKGILDSVNAHPASQKRWQQLIKGHDIAQTDAGALQLVSQLSESRNVSQFISQHKKELQNMHIDTRGSAQDVANRLLNKKATGDAKTERDAMNKLANAMADFIDKPLVHNLVKFMGPQVFGASVGLFGTGVTRFLKGVKDFLGGEGGLGGSALGNAAGSFAGSLLAGGKSLLTRGGGALKTAGTAAATTGAGAAAIWAGTGLLIMRATDQAAQFTEYQKDKAILNDPRHVRDLQRFTKHHKGYHLVDTGNREGVVLRYGNDKNNQITLQSFVDDVRTVGGKKGIMTAQGFVPFDPPSAPRTPPRVPRGGHHIQRPGDPPLSNQDVTRSRKGDQGGTDMIIEVALRNPDGTTQSRSVAHTPGDKTILRLHQRDPHKPKTRR